MDFRTQALRDKGITPIPLEACPGQRTRDHHGAPVTAGICHLCQERTFRPTSRVPVAHRDETGVFICAEFRALDTHAPVASVGAESGGVGAAGHRTNDPRESGGGIPLEALNQGPRLRGRAWCAGEQTEQS